MLTPQATLPFTIGAHERRALVGAVTFIEMAASENVGPWEVARWFEEHVVPAGVMAQPTMVLEPPIGTFALRMTEPGGHRGDANVRRVVGVARSRVLASLRGLIGTPSDDRFLRAAIFLGRVRREESRWVARPEPTAPLSCIVLSLFAVSILADRGLYDRQLCVCETCGRVSFDESSPTRATCVEHPPRRVHESGFSPRVVAGIMPSEGKGFAR